jgi:hypothetical protein
VQSKPDASCHSPPFPRALIATLQLARVIAERNDKNISYTYFFVFGASSERSIRTFLGTTGHALVSFLQFTVCVPPGAVGVLRYQTDNAVA